MRLHREGGFQTRPYARSAKGYSVRALRYAPVKAPTLLRVNELCAPLQTPGYPPSRV